MIGSSAFFAITLMFSAQAVAQRATIVPLPMQFEAGGSGMIGYRIDETT